jgi:hypothetical protein
MKRTSIAVALLATIGLASCEQNAVEVEPVGKYVIYENAGTSGTIKLNTVTGEAMMLIPSDNEIMHNGVTMGGKPLVWRKIANSQAQ